MQYITKKNSLTYSILCYLMLSYPILSYPILSYPIKHTNLNISLSAYIY